MAERLESTARGDWWFSPDRTPAPGERTRALLRARLVDEVSGEPASGPTQLTTPRADLWTRVASDALVGLVGQPARALPELAVAGVPLVLQVRSSGFLPRTLSATLGPIATFPADFAAIDLGDVPLHRPGVAVVGRVLHNLAPEPQPLAGAAVAIDAVWSQVPPPFWVPPALAEPADLVALHPGLYAERAAGTAVNELTLQLSAAAKTLLRPLVPGQTRLRLSDRDGLVAGGVLAIDFDAVDRVEMVRIAAVEPTPDPDEACWVTLAHPASQLHRDGVRCTDAAPQPPAGVAATSRDALPLDATLFLAAAPAMADGAWVEIDDGLAEPEYQRVALYAASTDADGHFRLPPIARVALIRLLVQHAAVTDGHPVVSLDEIRAGAPLVVALE